jgi:hypothetical protein
MIVKAGAQPTSSLSKRVAVDTLPFPKPYRHDVAAGCGAAQ